MEGLEILKSKIKEAPVTSGVYLFKNKKDQPIYIGKAINIKRRLSNYGQMKNLPRRLQQMVFQTNTIEFELTETERNALLLEALLIKKFAPRYNIRLKDDKSFPLIKISADNYPRISKFRNEYNKNDLVFGPFTSAFKTDKVLKILQKIFQLRSCTNQEFKNRSRPCLLYDIKQCSAPCVGKVNFDDYKHQVKNTIDFFKGNQNDITKDLEKEMLTASKLQKYERASEIRDSIQSLNFIIREEIKVGSQDSNYDFILVNKDKYLSIFISFIRYGRYLGGKMVYISKDDEDFKNIPSLLIQYYIKGFRPKSIICSGKIDNFKDLKAIFKEKLEIDLIVKNKKIHGVNNIEKISKRNLDKEIKKYDQYYDTNSEILNLTQQFFKLKNPIERIEGYDNSFYSNNYAVASYIVFNNEGFSIKDSRTYKFKDFDLKKFGDADLMKKVFQSRFEDSNKIIPDIILIDGGRPYLKICYDILKKFNLDDKIFLISISKGHNRDYRFDRYNTLYESNISLRNQPKIEGFLQKIRDKAHKLSKQNSLKRMSDSIKSSFLDDIKGIGKVKKLKIINYFGSTKILKQTSKEELLQIEGVNKVLAQTIMDKINNE